jgi:PKD repeat protein
VLSQGALTPSFSANVTSYRVAVASSVATLTVAPSTRAARATATVQGTPVASGAASGAIPLATGANTIAVVVTAADGTTRRTSTIQVTRAASPGAGSVVSRTSGVAPLAVHFEAGFLDSPEASARFHGYDYGWSFGDAGAGAWGTTGRSKNSAKGALATHVYEAAGTYTATLTVRDHAGVVRTETSTITVLDPETVYSGTRTTCVSSSGSFTGCPSGARQVTTTDLSTITPHATAGSRVLFRRGDAWTTTGLSWPANAGPVTIGAFGPGTTVDAQGLHASAPIITVGGTGGTFLPLDRKQDWRVMDLHLVGASWTNQEVGAFGGAMEMQRQLFLRIQAEHFSVPMGWSTWNTAHPMAIDDMVVASCLFSDAQLNVMYVGAEHLALLGNIARNASTSHVVRVWQAHRSVISENLISGSSLDNTAGRHALKLHGPGESGLSPADANGDLWNRTEYAIISGNVFGSSGPWPVNLAPQDSGSDERLSNLVFERNRYVQDHGDTSAIPLQIGLRIAAREVTARSNVVDGSGAGRYFTGIAVVHGGPEPAPAGVRLYNNTLFRVDTAGADGNVLTGISVDAAATGTVVRNNLVIFPGAPPGEAELLFGGGAGLTADHNQLAVSTGLLVDPNGADTLARDYALVPGSPHVDTGVEVPVFEDLLGNPRPAGGGYDLGAVETP